MAVLGAPRFCIFLWKNAVFSRVLAQNRGTPKMAVPTTTHPIPHLTPSEYCLPPLRATYDIISDDFSDTLQCQLCIFSVPQLMCLGAPDSLSSACYRLQMKALPQPKSATTSNALSRSPLPILSGVLQGSPDSRNSTSPFIWLAVVVSSVSTSRTPLKSCRRKGGSDDSCWPRRSTARITTSSSRDSSSAELHIITPTLRNIIHNHLAIALHCFCCMLQCSQLLPAATRSASSVDSGVRDQLFFWEGGGAHQWAWGCCNTNFLEGIRRMGGFSEGSFRECWQCKGLF